MITETKKYDFIDELCLRFHFYHEVITTINEDDFEASMEGVLYLLSKKLITVDQVTELVCHSLSHLCVIYLN